MNAVGGNKEADKKNKEEDDEKVLVAALAATGPPVGFLPEHYLRVFVASPFFRTSRLARRERKNRWTRARFPSEAGKKDHPAPSSQPPDSRAKKPQCRRLWKVKGQETSI